jgi:transcription elongation factor GreB
MSRAFMKESEDAPEIRLSPRKVEPVPEPPEDRSVIGIGARVTVDSVGTPESEFTIVGDDDADIGRGKIGFTSPLATALMGKRAGGRAVWHRPIGDRQLRIRAVSYD